MVQDSIFSKPVQSGHENLGQKVKHPGNGIFSFCNLHTFKDNKKRRGVDAPSATAVRENLSLDKHKTTHARLGRERSSYPQ
jgi:hypothetical protein